MDNDARVAEVYKREWRKEKSKRNAGDEQLRKQRGKLKEMTTALQMRDAEIAQLNRRLSDLIGERDQERWRRDKMKERLDDMSGLHSALNSYREDRSRLLREKVALENQLAQEQWKLKRMRNRRWWRLGMLLAEVRRHPRKLILLPVKVAKILSRRADPIPKPQTKAPPLIEETDDFRSESRFEPLAKAKDPAYLATSAPRSVQDLTIGTILDTMSYTCLEPDARLLHFRPDNYEAVLDNQRPDFILVESAWQGGGGAWQYMIGSYNYSETLGLPQLKSLLNWCSNQGIPTVFWNKEDPVHFDKFKEAARLFDYIFTTDANCLQDYLSLGISASQVDSLPFAAQPYIHNPIYLPGVRRRAACFAGTYYHNRHPERKKQLEMILDAAVPYGLCIYDRTHNRDDRQMAFPERFRPYIEGAVPYSQMVRIYKSYRAFLNVNSVTASPTMFSRRVFELLACGTPVVSTPALGIERLLGDAVEIVDNEADAQAAIARLVSDDKVWRDTSMQGLRAVLSEHTYSHRLAKVAEAIGIRVEARPTPSISVVVMDDQADIQRVPASIEKQHQRPVEVLVGTTACDLQSESVRLVHQDGTTSLRERYASLASMASSDWLALLDPTRAYPPDLLERLVQATLYTTADIIGVPSSGQEQRYTPDVNLFPILARRNVISSRGWVDSSDELTSWQQEGVRIFATCDSADAALNPSES